ncbi:hypothetical protein KKH23_06705 [Patescibacteria group bacterium]|nr:hypothetical protein [Patescibacteria group bacterium]MBU0846865.1 hypothetical protein [Patescibacteria group bacterium]
MITKRRGVITATRLENWQLAPNQLVPATLGEISVAFRHPDTSLSQMRRGEVGAPPSVHVGLRDLVILTAHILQHPVNAVEIVEQCGRFLQVDYTPKGYHDPQMIVAWMPGAGAFHEAMMNFQQAREGHFAREGPWYRACMEQAKRVLGPLARLHPHVVEAEFTIGWLLYTVATGQRI